MLNLKPVLCFECKMAARLRDRLCSLESIFCIFWQMLSFKLFVLKGFYQRYRLAQKIGPKSEFGPFGQNGPNSVRISCFGPKKEKFPDLLKNWSEFDPKTSFGQI